MKNAKQVENYVYAVCLTLLVLLLIVCPILSIAYEGSKIEVDTFTAECEITQLAYAEETVSKGSSQPAYKMGIRNDDFATTTDITADEFAKYSVGDVVTVEVRVYEYIDGSITKTYKIIP
jgi:hypothetical protein